MPSTSNSPPIYAEKPLGNWAMPTQLATTQVNIPIIHFFHVTNLGTLIDALA